MPQLEQDPQRIAAQKQAQQKMATNPTQYQPPHIPVQQSTQPTVLAPSPSMSNTTFDQTDFIKAPQQTSGIPEPTYFSYSNLSPSGQAKVQQGAAMAALGIVTPIAFVVAPEVALAGAIVSPIISEGLQFVPSNPVTGPYRGTWLTPQEVFVSIESGAVLSVVGGAALKGVASFAPRLAGEVANPFVRAATRIGINSGLGAGASGAFSFGNPQAIAQGAVFGAGFGAIGEGINVVGAKLVPSRDYVTRITGGSSKGQTVGTFGADGDLIESSRQFKIETTTEVIRDKSYAKYVKELMKNNPPSEIEFEGLGKTNYIVGESMETKVGATSLKAPAQPFMSAIKNEKYIAHVENLGKEGNMIAGDHTVSFSQTREGNFLSNGERESLKLVGINQKLTVYSDQYHSVKLWSEMSSEEYKNMLGKMKGYTPPFKQMGGLSYAQLEKPQQLFAPKLKVFTDIMDVYSVKPKFRIPIGLGLSSLAKVQASPRKVSMSPMVSMVQPTKQKQNQMPMFKPKPVSIPKSISMLTPLFIPKQSARTVPSQIPKITPVQIPKNIPKQTPQVAPSFNFPQPSKMNVPSLPMFGSGGGYGASGPKGLFSGRWYQKRHKIKTYSQMLKTFGVGGVGKPLRQIEKSTKHLAKSFKPKGQTKHRRHR
jgi:hypothetical protein